jgi:hypothetical protein
MVSRRKRSDGHVFKKKRGGGDTCVTDSVNAAERKKRKKEIKEKKEKKERKEKKEKKERKERKSSDTQTKPNVINAAERKKERTSTETNTRTKRHRTETIGLGEIKTNHLTEMMGRKKNQTPNLHKISRSSATPLCDSFSYTKLVFLRRKNE